MTRILYLLPDSTRGREVNVSRGEGKSNEYRISCETLRRQYFSNDKLKLKDDKIQERRFPIIIQQVQSFYVSKKGSIEGGYK